jgi:tetratricopeptide (TPR) repeat protein/transcriptional regulator with XRE-family HTH domain
VFGDVVRQHRRRLGLSQQDLAEQSGVTVRGLRKIESGRITTPRPVTVRLLADAFGLTGAERDQFLSAAHPPPAAPSRPASTAPAQLPTDVAGFAGRTQALSQLDALLDAPAGQPTAVVITAVSGTAGVGKTSLAVHWAHRVRDRFPDGQLYINLRGFDPSGAVMAAAEATRRFLDALQVPPQRIPADPSAQTDLYRTLLADRRMLVVLDNARDPDQVRPLLPGASGCFVLVTSRNWLTGLVAAEGAYPLLLDLVTPDEASDLLTRRLGRARVTAEPHAVDEIITRCARLPLALAIAAANAATHPHLPLTALADQLRHRRDRLDALSTGDTPTADVRAVFSWSYRALSDDAARLFRLLGLLPGPDISVAAVASLVALPIERARSLVNELANAHLTVEHIPGRYTVHDLLRAYAADLAHTVDSDPQRHDATNRMLDHYLHVAHTADRLLSPTRDAPTTVTARQPGVALEELAGPEQALAWFTAEHVVLLAAVAHAAATGFDNHAWQLAWTLDTFLDRRGHWHDQVATTQAAVAAARRLGDLAAQGRAHRYLARAHIRLGRLDEAHTQLRHALDLNTEAGDRVGQAYVHHALAHLWERQGRHRDALGHAQQALDLYRAAAHLQGQALALNAVGWYHAHLGDNRQAVSCCDEALALFEKLGDRAGQAATWDSLGYAYHDGGDHTQAVTCYQRAIDLYRGLGDRYNVAATLANLGDTHHVIADSDAARTAWQHALDLLIELDHPDAEQVRTKLDDLDHHL